MMALCRVTASVTLPQLIVPCCCFARIACCCCSGVGAPMFLFVCASAARRCHSPFALRARAPYFGISLPAPRRLSTRVSGSTGTGVPVCFCGTWTPRRGTGTSWKIGGRRLRRLDHCDNTLLQPCAAAMLTRSVPFPVPHVINDDAGESAPIRPSTAP